MSETLIRPLSPEQKLEQERIEMFCSHLGGLSLKSITGSVDVNHSKPAERATQVFMDNEYEFESAFYASSELYPILETEKLSYFEPFVARGGKASRHGVFFGALVTEYSGEIMVAVKPHARTESTYAAKKEADKSCLTDYFSNLAAKACGFESLNSLGVILNSEGDAYSITALDDDLSTLESFRWNRLYKPGESTPDRSGIWQKTSFLTGLLHATGNSMHGDLAARNIATNPYGQVFFIDWEDGNVSLREAMDIDERFGSSYVDLRKLIDSMATPRNAPNPGLGLFEKVEDSWWKAFDDLFFADYINTRRALAVEGSHHTRRAKEAEEELAELKRSLRNHIEVIQNRYK